MSTAATPKQADVLDYIRQHLNETGYAPTYDEIGEYLGICRATVFGHIDALERKGLIQRTKNCAGRSSCRRIARCVGGGMGNDRVH